MENAIITKYPSITAILGLNLKGENSVMNYLVSIMLPFRKKSIVIGNA